MSKRVLKGRSTDPGYNGSGSGSRPWVGPGRHPGGGYNPNKPYEPHWDLKPGDPGYLDPGNVTEYDGGSSILNGLGDLGYMHLGDAANTLGSGNFLDYMYQLLNGEVGASMSVETKRMILQQLMQYGFTVDQRDYDRLLTQDQRAYDEKMLADQRAYDKSLTDDQRRYNEGWRDEQRLYDSPTNQLARFMGAGISRDAALQMMSGGASGSVGVAPGAPVQGSSVSPGSPQNSGIPSGAGVASGNSTLQAVLGGIQAVADLANTGVNMALAINQVKASSMQNYMTSEQQQSYDAVNQIANYLSNGVTQGILSPDDLSSWRNADDVYRWLLDHQDTNFVKPLISSGSFHRTFGSSLGRSMFNKYWSDFRESGDAGTLYDNFIKQSVLQSEVQEIAVGQAKRDYYVSLTTTLNDIIKNDIELSNLWQQYQNGEIAIKINGELLDQEKYRTKSMYRQDFVDQADFDAYSRALDKSRLVNMDGQAVEITGRDVLNYHAYTKLIRLWQNDRVLSGRQAVDMPTSDGGKVPVEARDRYERYLDENFQAVITAAFINDIIGSNRLSGYSGDLSPLYKFADMWNASGLGSMVQSIGHLSPNINVNTGDRIFHNF